METGYQQHKEQISQAEQKPLQCVIITLAIPIPLKQISVVN